MDCQKRVFTSRLMNKPFLLYSYVKENFLTCYSSFLTIFLLLHFTSEGKTEKDSAEYVKRNKFIGLDDQAGRVLPSNDFVRGENESGEPIDYFEASRLEFGWQTMGTKLWEQYYNLPYFGIWIYGVDFFDDSELGTPSAFMDTGEALSRDGAGFR